jgi:hypothetical protein
MTDQDTIIQKIIEAKLASNRFQAANIATGCRLWELKTDEERLARVALYRAWRSSHYYPDKDTASCYAKAIAGEAVPQMEFFEWNCPICGMRLPSSEKHCPNNHKVDDGLELADYFNKALEEDAE